MTAAELAAQTTAWPATPPGSAGTCGDAYRVGWDEEPPPIPRPRQAEQTDRKEGR